MSPAHYGGLASYNRRQRALRVSRFRPCDQPRVQAHARTTDPRDLRILHLLAGTSWGGAEHLGSALHLLSQAHGYDSQLEAAHVPQELSAQLRVWPQPEEARPSVWARRARQRARQFAPDLVHAHLATPGMVGAAWLIAGSRPLVLTFQLLPESERFARDYVLRVPSAWLLHALSRRRAPCTLIAVSEADHARLSRRLPGAHIEVVPNRPQPPLTAAGGVHALSYPPSSVRLLSVGRLVEQKGFDRMLTTLAHPSLRALTWHWLIVGEGPERSALEQSIAAYGLTQRVRLLGAAPAHGLFEQADLVLCPSRYEGAPLVPQEALREGAPVLLSAIPVHRALCSKAEQALLPEDERAWPAHLLPLLQSDVARARLRHALTPLVQTLDPGAFWRDHARIYEQILDRARARRRPS